MILFLKGSPTTLTIVAIYVDQHDILVIASSLEEIQHLKAHLNHSYLKHGLLRYEEGIWDRNKPFYTDLGTRGQSHSVHYFES